MSELPPELAVEPEPTDADPPPEAIRPDRPRIWPEEPRAPRPQIKRPMEEWLAEFEERVKHQDPHAREQPSRRRRPRGLARIVPAPVRLEQPRKDATAERGRPEPADQQPRGRRRRRGGRGLPPAQPESVQGKAQSRPPVAPSRRGYRPTRPSPTRREGNQPSPPKGAERPPQDSNRRRRRRGRGRGRGPRPGGPPGQGGSPNSPE